MQNETTTTKKTRKAAEYMIVRKSYWSGDTWKIAGEGAFKSREAAEQRIAELGDDRADTDIKRRNHYRVLSMSQIVREFGKEWFYHAE